MPNFLDKVTNTLDGYVADAKNIKGTYVVVSAYSELANLPSATVVEGTLAFVQSEDKIYIYDGTNWSEWETGISKIIINSENTTYTLSSSDLAKLVASSGKPFIIIKLIYSGTSQYTSFWKATEDSGYAYFYSFAGNADTRNVRVLVVKKDSGLVTYQDFVMEDRGNKKSSIDAWGSDVDQHYYPSLYAVKNYVKDKTKYIIVSTATNLPSSNVAEGTLAYVQDTNSFKLYNGSAWTAVDIINSNEPATPERFSIAYNLVVNMNQQQFEGGSWTGTNNDSTRAFQYNGANATKAKAKELVEFLTGSSVLDEYDADKPTPCFVFTKQANICWKLQWDTNVLHAYKVSNFPFALKDDVNPIIDVAELPTTNINSNKFYRVEQIGEDIVVGVPTDFTTPFCNLVFNTALSVSEVMEIISDTSIAYNQNEEEVNGVTLEFGFYNITWNYSRPENCYSILYCPESLGTPFALIVNWCFMDLMQGDTPSGTPQVLWCNNGTILSQFTSGLMEFTGWNPNITNPINLVFWTNETTEQPNTAISNDKLTNLVWCSKYKSLKKLTEVYENGDTSTTAVSMCKAFFSTMFNSQITTVTTMPSSASDVKANILNGNYPYYIHKDSNTQYYIVALLAEYNNTTLEPNTEVTIYCYIEVIMLDSSNDYAPTAVQNMLADLPTIYYAINETLPGTMTVDLEVKKKVTLYHYKNKWYVVGSGAGGSSELEFQILSNHIAELESRLATNNIEVTTNNGVVIFTIEESGE